MLPRFIKASQRGARFVTSIVLAVALGVCLTASDARAQPNAPADAPLAGFHDGLFYLRDRDDVFRLYIQARVHVDALASFGPGVQSLPVDSALQPGLFLRRARVEMGGEFFEKWQWQLSAEFGPTAVDNLGAKSDTRACGIDSKTGALSCSDQSAAVQAPSAKPAPTDVFVNYAAKPWLNFQVGQYLVPFGMEARISDNTTYFLERSITARAIAAPTTRDLGGMIWGELPRRSLYWTVGIYNGDGQNRLNVDSRFDIVTHAIVKPFVYGGPKILEDAQIGASFRGGSRDAKDVGYDISPLTTQGGFVFFRSTYHDSLGRLIHIIPSTQQIAVGGDTYIPIGKFDISGEFAYMDENTREAVDGYQLAGFTERTGGLRGYSYYVQAGYWILGSREMIGYPSNGKPLSLDLSKPAQKPIHGLQVVTKFEQLHLTYAGSRRGGADDALTPSGDINVDAFSLGINYWATRHLRVSLNYSGYAFPGSEPATASHTGGPVQTSSERAISPGQILAKGVDDSARDGSHELHEVQARIGVQF